MPEPHPPINRSVGLSGVLRFLVAVAAIIAIAAAIEADRWGLAIAGVVFLVAAIVLSYRASRARGSAEKGS